MPLSASPSRFLAKQVLGPKLGQLSMPTSRLPPQHRTSFPSLRRRPRWLGATPRQELYKVKSFPPRAPPALASPSPPRSPFALVVRERAPAGAKGSPQITL